MKEEVEFSLCSPKGLINTVDIRDAQHLYKWATVNHHCHRMNYFLIKNR